MKKIQTKKYFDKITGAELTPQNVVRCFDGYLNTVSTSYGNVVRVRDFTLYDDKALLDIMDYIKFTVSIGDNELTLFLVNRFIGHLCGV